MNNMAKIQIYANAVIFVMTTLTLQHFNTGLKSWKRSKIGKKFQRLKESKTLWSLLSLFLFSYYLFILLDLKWSFLFIIRLSKKNLLRQRRQNRPFRTFLKFGTCSYILLISFLKRIVNSKKNWRKAKKFTKHKNIIFLVKIN